MTTASSIVGRCKYSLSNLRTATALMRLLRLFIKDSNNRCSSTKQSADFPKMS